MCPPAPFDGTGSDPSSRNDERTAQQNRKVPASRQTCPVEAPADVRPAGQRVTGSGSTAVRQEDQFSDRDGVHGDGVTRTLIAHRTRSIRHVPAVHHPGTGPQHSVRSARAPDTVDAGDRRLRRGNKPGESLPHWRRCSSTLRIPARRSRASSSRAVPAVPCGSILSTTPAACPAVISLAKPLGIRSQSTAWG